MANISNKFDKLILADIMIILYIYSIELKTLHIANSKITDYIKN